MLSWGQEERPVDQREALEDRHTVVAEDAVDAIHAVARKGRQDQSADVVVAVTRLVLHPDVVRVDLASRQAVEGRVVRSSAELRLTSRSSGRRGGRGGGRVSEGVHVLCFVIHRVLFTDQTWNSSARKDTLARESRGRWWSWWWQASHEQKERTCDWSSRVWSLEKWVKADGGLAFVGGREEKGLRVSERDDGTKGREVNDEDYTTTTATGEKNLPLIRRKLSVSHRSSSSSAQLVVTVS